MSIPCLTVPLVWYSVEKGNHTQITLTEHYTWCQCIVEVTTITEQVYSTGVHKSSKLIWCRQNSFYNLFLMNCIIVSSEIPFYYPCLTSASVWLVTTDDLMMMARTIPALRKTTLTTLDWLSRLYFSLGWVQWLSLSASWDDGSRNNLMYSWQLLKMF